MLPGQKDAFLMAIRKVAATEKCSSCLKMLKKCKGTMINFANTFCVSIQHFKIPLKIILVPF